MSCKVRCCKVQPYAASPDAMNNFFPFWARHYRRQHLGADLLAGLVVTVLVLPQSLAYAMLAGLPPQAGLYVSILPVVAYALVGSSMTQSVGPVAITAIMTFSVLSPWLCQAARTTLRWPLCWLCSPG